MNLGVGLTAAKLARNRQMKYRLGIGRADITAGRYIPAGMACPIGLKHIVFFVFFVAHRLQFAARDCERTKSSAAFARS